MEYKPGKIRNILRVYALLLVMLMILPVTSTKVQASDQILIGSAAEMKKIGKDEAYPLSGNYRLTADISMDEMIAGAFTGVFDGYGHTITVITGKTTYTYTYELSDEIFEPLMAKGEATGRKIRVTWNNVKGANRYVIYLASCNTRKNTYKLQKVKSVKAATGAKTMSWTSKKLKKGEDYKFRVKALRKINGKAKYETIGTSRVGHAIVGGENARYTNPKSLKLSASKITLKKGEKATVTGKITGVNKKKTVLNHTAELRFTCYPNGVAKVNSKGVITAKKAGTTRVYVQTVNGIWKTVKVTVK